MTTTAALNHNAVAKQIAGINEPLRLRKEFGFCRTYIVNMPAPPSPITMPPNGDGMKLGRMNITNKEITIKRTALYCCLARARKKNTAASRRCASDSFMTSPLLVLIRRWCKVTFVLWFVSTSDAGGTPALPGEKIPRRGVARARARAVPRPTRPPSAGAIGGIG